MKNCKYCNKEFEPKKKRQIFCSYSCSIRSRNIDLIGKKFGYLTVLDCIGTDNSQKRLWKCKCECGNEITVNTNLLTGSKVKSCGCKKSEMCSKVNRKEYGKSSFNTLFHNYKRGAERRHILFNLNEEEFKNITSQNCYYCGIMPSQIVSSNNGNYVYNGIDRIDNEKGYEKDNVTACCGICNKMKHAFTESFFISHIQKILNHKIQKG